VLNLKYLLQVAPSSRMWWLSNLFFFKDLISVIYFSVYFYNSNLLASFISRNITNSKKQYRLMKSIRRIINYFFWFERAPGFYGISISVHGKFHGILRKRKFQLRFGRIGKHTLKNRIDCSYKQSFTRFGVFSIKVWLLYNK
jgi:ribosomal protein S3